MSPMARTTLQRPPAGNDAAIIERLRAICMALPEANERLSHGEPTWFAGKGKSFAMLDNHHHGAPHLSVLLPQPPGVQEELVGLESFALLRTALRRGKGLGGRDPRIRSPT